MKGTLLVVTLWSTVAMLMTDVAAGQRKHKKKPLPPQHVPPAPLVLPCDFNATELRASTTTSSQGERHPSLSSLPAVDTDWYPVPYSYPFATQSPLTQTQLQRGLPAALTPELLHLFAPLLRRLTTYCLQERVMVLGGSFAAGQACCPAEGWPWRVFRWLQAAFPRAQLEYTSHAFGSTTSHQGLSTLRALPAHRFPHLLLLGYAINDNANVEASGHNSSLLFLTEEIIRLCAQQAAAGTHTAVVMYLVESLADQAPAVPVYETVCGYYSAQCALVSYRRAVLDEVKAAAQSKKHNSSLHTTGSGSGSGSRMSIYWSKDRNQPHPNWISHMLIKEMFAHLFTRVARELHHITTNHHDHHHSRSISSSGRSSSSGLPPPASYPLPPRAFSPSSSSPLLHSALSSSLSCSPATRQYTSLTRSPAPPSSASPAPSLSRSPANISTFRPYHREFSSDYFKREGDEDYYRGWEFRRDKPLKPLGWIAGGRGGREDMQQQGPQGQGRGKDVAHIAFVVDLISGQVSIDYLASYENAGVVEIWLSELSYLMPLKLLECGKWKMSPEKRARLCCDNSAEKINIYPHIHGMKHTHTQYLDTFVNMSTKKKKFSEIVTKTFSLNSTGMLLLHLLHRRLPEEEMAQRKGDKVKILGVSSC